MTQYRSVYETQIGTLTIAGDGEAITHVLFEDCPGDVQRRQDIALHETAICQIREYLRGERREFELPLRPQGTAFQQSVWAALLQIPYGETRSYGEIARMIDRPRAYRAVGMANNRNPISIVIPCHRVIGADGSLTGYGGGLAVKERLLKLEKDGAC